MKPMHLAVHICIGLFVCLFAVGVSCYQAHSTPVDERKDFMLNLSGLGSLHPSASGYYSHHHPHYSQQQHVHPSVQQDIKPCVM